MNLNQLDLNLLIILKQLLEEKHISNTALTLGLSQPSISRSLAKLRKLFDDPLLIRMTGGYQLTPKAQAIQLDLNEILSRVENLVNKQNFDPKTSEATIKLFGLPPQMNQLIEATIKAFRQQAPNMTLEIDTLTKPHFSDLLKGDVHFVVTGHQPKTGEDKLYHLPLFQRHFMLVMSKDHPLANKALTIDQLRHCNFGQISMQGEKGLSIAQCFQALNININTPILLKDMYSIGTIAEHTDTIFYLPNNFAQNLNRTHNVVIHEAPSELDIGLTQVSLFWHQRYHNDPICSWFRGLVKSQVFEN